jgi:hypothetical protein
MNIHRQRIGASVKAALYTIAVLATALFFTSCSLGQDGLSGSQVDSALARDSHGGSAGGPESGSGGSGKVEPLAPADFLGELQFSHSEHQGKGIVDCTMCHVGSQGAHGSIVTSADACIACHEGDMSESEHVFHKQNLPSFQCLSCHGNNAYPAAIANQDCIACHTAG